MSEISKKNRIEILKCGTIVTIAGIASIVISIFMLFDEIMHKNDYGFLFLLPLILGSYMMFGRIKKFFLKNIIVTAFFSILIVKYCITPLIMVISKNYTAGWIETTEQGRHFGLFIMVYELIIILIVMDFLLRKKNIQDLNNIKNQDDKLNSKNNNNGIFILAIIIGLISPLLFPQILDNFNVFIIKNQDYQNRSAIVILASYFTEFIQVIVFLIIANNIYEKQSHKSYWLLLLFGFLNIIIIWSTNRMITIIVALAVFSFLKALFPNSGKKMLIISTFAVIFMVVIMTTYRMSGEDGSLKVFLDLDYLQKSFQLYFSGPDVYAAVVDLNNNDINVSFKSFLIDGFVSVNGIREFSFFKSNAMIGTTSLFDFFISNGGSPGTIIPLAGQAYLYFGFILSPIFSVIFLIFLFKIIQKSKNEKNLGLKYCYFYLACNLLFFPIYNYTILMQNVFNRFIPLFLICLLNKIIKINIKKT